MAKIAVVTGSNKGLGCAIVKGLANQIDGIVYLTARNEKLGNEAVAALKKELGSPAGDKIRYHQLDVTDSKSIENLRDFLKKEHQGLDILVQNAGLLGVHPGPDISLAELIKKSFEVNYFGVKNVHHALYPLLKPHAREVIVGSRMGALKNVKDEKLQELFTSPNLTESQVEEVMDTYAKHGKEGKLEENGFPTYPYKMSKLVAIALNPIYHKQMLNDSRSDLIINCCCPGLVWTPASEGMLTKLGKKIGDKMGDVIIKSPEEGADTPVYLATLPDNVDGPKGEFIGERNVLDWANMPAIGPG